MLVDVVDEVVDGVAVGGVAGAGLSVVVVVELLTVGLGAGWVPTSEVVWLVCPGVGVEALFVAVAAGLPLFPSDAQAIQRAGTTQSNRSVDDIRMTSLGIASAAWTRQGPKSPPAAFHPRGPKTSSASGGVHVAC